MWESFTDESKSIVAEAQRQAQGLGHNYVGTEHILLALLELEDDGGTLTSLGLQKQATEAEIRTIIEALARDKDAG